MKRTRSYEDNNVSNNKSKRTKYDTNKVKNLELWKTLDTKVVNSSDWISATKTKNYLLKDPVLDWLEKYYMGYGFGDNSISKEKIKKDKEQINKEFSILENTLFKKGNEFEKLIYKELENRVGKRNCIDVITSYKECCYDKMKDTIKYMELGIPIIKQAVLYNDSNKTYGIADFLIRSDYINELFDDEIQHINDDEVNIGCKFSTKYHYRVVDIKWSQLQLCSDGFKILNTDRFPAYKGQLAIYNLALGKIQNYVPHTAYILGKSYRFEFQSDKYYGESSFNRLGHILFDDFDNKYIELTKNAIDWYRDMLSNGCKWNLVNSYRPELCPNMCNNNDAPYTNIKHELAKKKFEITSIWKVGIKNRETAFSNNIFKWNDEKCTSKTLGLSKNTSVIVDNILDVNRSKEILYSPEKIKSELYNWRDEKKYFDFYIDFETINDVFYKDDVNIRNNYNENYIFMVGVGYVDFNKNWVFKEFHLDKLNPQEEVQMIKNFQNYVMEIFEQNKKLSTSKMRFFHWSQAETIFLEKFNDKNNNIIGNFINNIEFADLYKIFITEPITINGAVTFKLKDISNALADLGLIQSNWKKLDISNGLTAMLDGCTYYKFVEKNIPTKEMTDLFQQIINYNEIDCKVMSEIVNWMRVFA
jgi:hypothetical protein